MLEKVATFVATLRMLRMLHVATRTYHGGDTPGNYYRGKKPQGRQQDRGWQQQTAQQQGRQAAARGRGTRGRGNRGRGRN